MIGKFFWYDLMTPDPLAAQRFYCETIGWGARDSGTPGAGYTLFTVDGRGVGGLKAMQDDECRSHGQPTWMGYIGVDDLDRMIERVCAEGGTVLRGPWQVPQVIRLALVADPQGVPFMLAKPLVSDAPPPPPAGTPGTVGWHELYTSRWQSAITFYEKLFGWSRAQALEMGAMGTYQIFSMGGAPAGGMMDGPTPGACRWGFYFYVSRLDAAVQRLSAGGGSVLNGPMEVPGGQWIVQAADPQGAAFSLLAARR